MIAGELPNSPQNLVRWIRDPKSVEPGTAMPNLGLTEYEADDVAPIYIHCADDITPEGTG
jgi:cytochrome c1